jgi:broad specificity phosphatase PhoE
MRTIEIRRHCYTKKGEVRVKGSRLSAEGVMQARRIGEQIGPYNLVLSSDIPRTLETALAMGFAVDEQWTVLGDIPADVWEELGHQERWTWDAPFVQFARFVSHNGPTARLGKHQQTAWTQALESVPPNGRVLIVSHGRIIETGLVTYIPDGDFSSWGRPFGHGEGVCLQYENAAFINVQIRRIV